MIIEKYIKIVKSLRYGFPSIRLIMIYKVWSYCVLRTPGSQHWRVRLVKRGRKTVPGRSQGTCKRLREKGPWRVPWIEEKPNLRGALMASVWAGKLFQSLGFVVTRGIWNWVLRVMISHYKKLARSDLHSSVSLKSPLASVWSGLNMRKHRRWSSTIVTLSVGRL